MVLRYAILGLLEGQELHGYRIKSVFEERIGATWSLNFGQIYQSLKDLKRRGLVECRLDEGEGHLNRWVYTITPRGRRSLDTWLKRSPKRPQPLRDEIFIRLLVLDRKDVDASLAQLANQEHVYRQHLTELTTHRRSLEPITTEERLLNSLAVDAALFRAEAHLRWLAHCAEVLKAWQPHTGAEGATGDAPPPSASPSIAESLAPSGKLTGRPRRRR